PPRAGAPWRGSTISPPPRGGAGGGGARQRRASARAWVHPPPDLPPEGGRSKGRCCPAIASSELGPCRCDAGDGGVEAQQVAGGGELLERRLVHVLGGGGDVGG